MIGFTELQVERFAEQLRDTALIDYRQRISLESLSPEHRAVFTHALKNVLSTELALFTFAQIVDGLPTADVGWDRRDHGLWGDHPLDGHDELCPGAVEKARELRDLFDISTLKFNPKVVQAYRKAREGTKQFNTRLIELVAVAVHQLGGRVYNMKLHLHKGDVDSVANWVKPYPADSPSAYYAIPPRPTIFNHAGFLEKEIYPEKEADIAGYWTEDRIFGGVVAFDQRADGADDATLPNVYYHPSRWEVTVLIFQLRDAQQNALIAFLLAETTPPPPEPCPLPILGDRENRVRIHAHEAIIHYRVYRDVWERRPWTQEDVMIFQRRPKSEIDHPVRHEFLNLEFLPSGRPYESFFEEVGLPVPWKDAGEDENDIASGSSPEEGLLVDPWIEYEARFGLSGGNNDGAARGEDGKDDSTTEKVEALNETLDRRGSVDRDEAAAVDPGAGSCEFDGECEDHRAKQ